MRSDLFTKDSLLLCAEKLKRKKFNPGFDGMSMSAACSWIQINGTRLCREISAESYTPMPAVGFRTAKHRGGFRILSKTTAIDTIIQNVILEELVKPAEELFSDNSFAYRPGRGVSAAVERYVTLANKYRFASKIDFVACFDNLDHSVLESQVKQFFGENYLSRLCMLFAKTPLFIDGEVVPTEKGVLQGMPLSPLLCNIYFHAADLYLASLDVPFVRYADDIVVFGDSADVLLKMNVILKDYFEKELHLKCNRKKIKTDSSAKIEFLGYRFASDKRGVIGFSDEAENLPVYPDWHSKKPENNRRRIDLISDGILRQKDFSLLFDTETVDSDIPVSATDVINVYSDVIFDSGVIEKAASNGVTINVFNKYGDCVGSFVPNTSVKSPKLLHEQLMAYYNQKQRIKLAKEFLLASLHNSNLIIRYYNKQNPEELYKKALGRLQTLKTKIKAETDFENLLLLEAQMRETYYSCFDLFINKNDFVFEKRTRKPPRNEVNALISFGNTVLYNLIATEIQKTPLDVGVGFLHSTNKRAKSLNLDIAEIFKPLIVDRVIFSLINKKEIMPHHFVCSEKNAVYLSAQGKQIFLRAFYKKLDAELMYKNQSLSYRKIIVEEIRKLAGCFRNNEPYKAYRQVR